MATFSFNLLTLRIKQTKGPLRKVTIPDYYTFGHLHQLFLFLFDWNDNHLHVFKVPQQLDGSPELEAVNPAEHALYNWILEMAAQDPERFADRGLPPSPKMRQREPPKVMLSNLMPDGSDCGYQNEAIIPLSFGFKNVGASVEYEYDLGASWTVKIDLLQTESQTVRSTEYTPGVIVIGGRGPTIPKYDGQFGKAYNRNALNEELGQMNKFVYYPPNVNVEEKDANKEDDDDNEDDEDDDLQPNPNHNNVRRNSVLGKRIRQHYADPNIFKKRRSK